MATKVENKFKVKNEIRRINRILRDAGTNDEGKTTNRKKTKNRKKNNRNMMKRKANTIAQVVEAESLPQESDSKNEDATQFNRSVKGATEVDKTKKTSVPKKRKQKVEP